MQSRPDTALAFPDATRPVVQGAQPGAAASVPAELEDALRLVGPDQQGELLDRLAADLARSAALLTQARARRDARGLREAAHVLTALLGTVGAAEDAAAAGALREAVAAGAWPRIDAAAGAVGRRVAGLRDVVAARRAACGPLPERGRP
jgi:hypothetical protein